MEGSQTHADEPRRMQTNARQTASGVWADATSRRVQTLDICSRTFGTYYNYMTRNLCRSSKAKKYLKAPGVHPYRAQSSICKFVGSTFWTLFYLDYWFLSLAQRTATL